MTPSNWYQSWLAALQQGILATRRWYWWIDQVRLKWMKSAMIVNKSVWRARWRASRKRQSIGAFSTPGRRAPDRGPWPTLVRHSRYCPLQESVQTWPFRHLFGLHSLRAFPERAPQSPFMPNSDPCLSTDEPTNRPSDGRTDRPLFIPPSPSLPFSPSRSLWPTSFPRLPSAPPQASPRQTT